MAIIRLLKRFRGLRDVKLRRSFKLFKSLSTIKPLRALRSVRGLRVQTLLDIVESSQMFDSFGISEKLERSARSESIEIPHQFETVSEV